MKKYHNRPDYDVELYEWDEKEEKEIPHVLRAKIITPSLSRKLDKIATDKKLDNTDRVLDQMVILFGHEKKFYEKFDLFLMNDVIVDVVNDIILKKNKST